MIFSSSGANCSIFVAMGAPPAYGAFARCQLVYRFVDSCRLFQPAPILLPTMAAEINGGVRSPKLLDRVRAANRLRQGEGGRVDPEPGAERAAVSVPLRPATGLAVAR